MAGRSGEARRTPAAVLTAFAAVVAVAALGGCGDGGISLPSDRPSLPSGIASELPTTLVPAEPTTETLSPDPTVTPSPTDTTVPVTPTETTAAPTETTAAPTETVTATATATATPTEEPSPEPSGDAAGPTAGEEEGLSPWWLVLLAVLVLVALLWWGLARSARRRREHTEALAGLESRGRWAVDHGVGALIGASDPGSVQEAWSRLDATLTDMARDVRRLSAAGLADVGATTEARDATSGLKLAAESHARARLGGADSPATAESLFVARSRLNTALEALRDPDER